MLGKDAIVVQEQRNLQPLLPREQIFKIQKGSHETYLPVRLAGVSGEWVDASVIQSRQSSPRGEGCWGKVCMWRWVFLVFNSLDLFLVVEKGLLGFQALV